MYTILVTEDNELITSVRERIMQRSKLVDSLHFLVDQIYKEIEMIDFTVVLEYISPQSKEYHTEILTLSDELYKDKLEYKLPFDTALTKEAGDIEVQLSFTKVDLDADGNNMQYVRKTSPVNITIVPISAWSDIVLTDGSLTALDKRYLQLEGKIKELEEISDVYNSEKADNINLDDESKEIYLTSKGNVIGNRISINNLGDSLAKNTDDGLIQVIL